MLSSVTVPIMQEFAQVGLSMPLLGGAVALKLIDEVHVDGSKLPKFSVFTPARGRTEVVKGLGSSASRLFWICL